jgi:hypothetical protein
MNIWKLCGIIFFTISFVLLAVGSFFVIVAAYSPVEHVGQFSNSRFWDVSVSVEVEPFAPVILFVFSVALIAIGAMCFVKSSQANRTIRVSHEEQPK